MDVGAYAGSARTAADRAAAVERQRLRGEAREARAREATEAAVPALIAADDEGCVRLSDARMEDVNVGVQVVVACLRDPAPETGLGPGRPLTALCAARTHARAAAASTPTLPFRDLAPGPPLPADSRGARHLDSCALLHIPPAIGQLDSLRTLNLGYNLLEDLPAEICTLPSLRSLFVNNNRLSSLVRSIPEQPPHTQRLSEPARCVQPEAIGSLKQLEFLYADHNRIRAVPASIAELFRLRTLWLHTNPVRKLPRELKALAHLESVRIDSDTTDTD